jgi:hypothetical protein
MTDADSVTGTRALMSIGLLVVWPQTAAAAAAAVRVVAAVTPGLAQACCMQT